MTDKADAALSRSARWLARFNELDERGRGETPSAEAALRKSQYWLDRYNHLTGKD